MKGRSVVLVDGVRSAFARAARGQLVATRLDDVGAQLIRALLDRQPRLQPRGIEEIGLGHMAGRGEFAQMGAIPLLAGLPLEAASFHSNRQAGSGMESFQRIAMEIAVGMIDCGLAIGVERMARRLTSLDRRSSLTRVTKLHPRLFQLNELQRSPTPDHATLFSVRFPEYLLKSPPLQSMLQTSQNVAEVYGLERGELDAYALSSHRKAEAAYRRGVFKDEIVPLEIESPVFDHAGTWLEDEQGPRLLFERDESVRPTARMDGLTSLPVLQHVMSFDERQVVVTAGNSSPTSDGVSIAALMSETQAVARGIEPLARVVGMSATSVKPQLTGLGVVPAARRALDQAGLEIGAIDRIESDESFAAHTLAMIRELGAPPDRVNVHGGSIALGNPLGATGTRLVTTLAKELRRSGTRYGLALQCAGAGMGMATLLERLD